MLDCHVELLSATLTSPTPNPHLSDFRTCWSLPRILGPYRAYLPHICKSYIFREFAYVKVIRPSTLSRSLHTRPNGLQEDFLSMRGVNTYLSITPSPFSHWVLCFTFHSFVNPRTSASIATKRQSAFLRFVQR